MAAFGQLVPLIVFLLLVVIAGAIGYIAYTIANDVKTNTKKHMEKKNVVMSRQGMKVGVKEVSTEKYADNTQKYGSLPGNVVEEVPVQALGVLVKIWNNSNWPAYKSRLGWGTSVAQQEQAQGENRKPYSRSSSSQQSVQKVKTRDS